VTRHTIRDDDGNWVATYCGEPLEESGQQAIRALISAALRDIGEQDPDAVVAERQQQKTAEVRDPNH
jgi:hypothetical protein